jgi:hypothetical protein
MVEYVAFDLKLEVMEVTAASVDAVYEPGCYQRGKITEKHIQMACLNPFLSDFGYGIVYAIAWRFSPREACVFANMPPQRR